MFATKPEMLDVLWERDLLSCCEHCYLSMARVLMSVAFLGRDKVQGRVQ